jgi:hypothetical protein
LTIITVQEPVRVIGFCSTTQAGVINRGHEQKRRFLCSRGKARPGIKPSGMERRTTPKSTQRGKRRRRGKSAPQASVERQVLKVAAPTGSRFKDYQDFVVQDLVLRAQVIRYRQERWVTPEGQTILAGLPSGISGQFGPELRRFILLQHCQDQVTVERLTEQLRAIGFSISKCQVMLSLGLQFSPKVGFENSLIDVPFGSFRWG